MKRKNTKRISVKKKSIIRIISAFLVGVMLTGCGSSADYEMDEGVFEEEEIAEDIPSEGFIDTITPGSDYYGYVNARDLWNMGLENNKLINGSTAILSQSNTDKIDGILDEIINSSESFERGSNEQIIHDFYYLAYDQLSGDKEVDAENTEFVDEFIARLDGVSSVDEYLDFSHDIVNEFGYSAYLNFFVSPNLLDNSEKLLACAFSTDLDLEQMKENQFTAIAYRDEMTDTLKTVGIPADEAKDRATDVIYMLYEISNHTDYDISNGEKESYEYFNIFTREECESLLHNVSYEKLVYAGGYNGEAPERLVILDPEQFEAIDSIMDEEHLEAWKDMTLYFFIKGCEEWLPEKYNFSGNEVTNPEKQARSYVKELLQKEVGEEFAERYLTDEKREIVTQMCEDMRDEYRVLISDADWLSEEGRGVLLDKLNNMLFFIGADEPHEVNPSDADFLDTTMLKTMMNLNSRQLIKEFDALYETPVRNGFDGVNVTEANACYQPTINSVTIYIGIMDTPFFDENVDYATNLGTLGTTLGHEISHAFDSNGVKYDSEGNYNPDIMPEEDIKAFEEIQEKAITYYDGFTVLGSHVNGKKTLAENLADISGLQCALAIAKEPEEQEKVLVGYALSWQTLMEDSQAKMQLEADEHAPDIVRVNAVVACFDEFYEIYGVKEGDAMYIAPEERVRRW